MKQYTDESQTTKLIELGFEKPKSAISYSYPVQSKEQQAFEASLGLDPYLATVDQIEFEYAYSIGELIDFIPDTGSEFMRNRQIFGQGVRFYTDHCIYDFDEEPELIDNLFNLVVRLKENGEI